MHPSAMRNGSRFFETYVRQMSDPLVVDVGSQDVFGSLRSVLPPNARYLGVDMVAGKNVDLVIEDPYTLPFEQGSIDVIVSSSCFEHSEFFWLAYLEMMRVLKPFGLIYLNVPSSGPVHRYPVDCWRFYPDSGKALARWAQRNGFSAELLESYVDDQSDDHWCDFVCVLLRDKTYASRYPRRMVHSMTEFSNGFAYPDLEQLMNAQELPQDLRLLAAERQARLGNRVRSALGAFERAVRRSVRNR
jgi:SAM-dependent methyltransferase